MLYVTQRDSFKLLTIFLISKKGLPKPGFILRMTYEIKIMLLKCLPKNQSPKYKYKKWVIHHRYSPGYYLHKMILLEVILGFSDRIYENF